MNRIVDITPWINKRWKLTSPIDSRGCGGKRRRLRSRLAAQKLRLPILGNDDETANREYIKHFVLDQLEASLGCALGPGSRPVLWLEWAEAFHYIGPVESMLDRYIAEHAVPL